MYTSNKFASRGFSFIHSKSYISENEIDSVQSLNDYYANTLAFDGPRKRAYLKLEWDRDLDQIQVSENQAYFQTASSNNADGGKPRYFKTMPVSILNLQVMGKLLEKNISIISKFEPLEAYEKLTLGLHFIQYIAEKGSASYSSPVGLHIDDEPLVFVHLISLSEHALGGDNLIANLDTQEITHVIRLEKPLDTIVLNNNCYHAVTPLGSREGVSIRNVLLFTVEPHFTQI